MHSCTPVSKSLHPNARAPGLASVQRGPARIMPMIQWARGRLKSMGFTDKGDDFFLVSLMNLDRNGFKHVPDMIIKHGRLGSDQLVGKHL